MCRLGLVSMAFAVWPRSHTVGVLETSWPTGSDLSQDLVSRGLLLETELVEGSQAADRPLGSVFHIVSILWTTRSSCITMTP